MRFYIYVSLLSTLLSVKVNCDPTHSLILYDPSEYKEQNEHIIHRARRELSNTSTIIKSMKVMSDVSLRYANTSITAQVINPAATANEAKFSVILPETAYISGFIMEVDDKEFVAYVKEKEEAKRIYDTAVASGQAAAHVETRDSNHFTVSVNLEPMKKAIFKLRYEELLVKKDGLYNLVINLNPGQLLDEMVVDVNINELSPISFVLVPEFRSGNEIEDFDISTNAGNQFATKDFYDNKHGVKIHFAPDKNQQMQLMKEFEDKVKQSTNSPVTNPFDQSEDQTHSEGISGQFVVQYDVDLDAGGEILINDGYFVHFFAPRNLNSLSKYVVFVLDTSGSMSGTKIQQLKEAMLHIIDDLKPTDLFSIVTFDHESKVLQIDPEHPNKPTPVNPVTIAHAKSIISSLEAPGYSTNMEIGLRDGLRLINELKSTHPESNKNSPIMIFLTDGEVNQGAQGDNLLIIAKELNAHKTPIFTLGFGRGADRKLMKKLALQNNGFMKHIYEAADASKQLNDFYRQISSPLLVDVHYSYPKEQIDDNSVTNTNFSRLFNGTELVVTGKIKNGRTVHSDFCFMGNTDTNLTEFRPKLIEVKNERSWPMERLWAYLTIKQLMDDMVKDESNANNIRKKALELALKYSFVTPVTSLVVVKPNVTTSVNAERVETGLYNRRGQNFYPMPNFANTRMGSPSYSNPGFATSQRGGIMASYPVPSGGFMHQAMVLSAPSSSASSYSVPSHHYSISTGSYSIPSIPYYPSYSSNPHLISGSAGYPTPFGASGPSGTFGMYGPPPNQPSRAFYPGASGSHPTFFHASAPIPFYAPTTTIPFVNIPQPPLKRSKFDLENYPWIEQYIPDVENVMNVPLHEDGHITTLRLQPKLNSWGVNLTSEACDNAIDGGTGTCVYLTSCKNLNEGFKDLATYKNFYCINQMYAAICCKNL